MAARWRSYLVRAAVVLAKHTTQAKCGLCKRRTQAWEGRCKKDLCNLCSMYQPLHISGGNVNMMSSTCCHAREMLCCTFTFTLPLPLPFQLVHMQVGQRTLMQFLCCIHCDNHLHVTACRWRQWSRACSRRLCGRWHAGSGCVRRCVRFSICRCGPCCHQNCHGEPCACACSVGVCSCAILSSCCKIHCCITCMWLTAAASHCLRYSGPCAAPAWACVYRWCALTKCCLHLVCFRNLYPILCL